MGSSRADVEALGPVIGTYDGDGDGLPDSMGLEATPVPGTESLVTPGQTGIGYLRVRFAGDTVSSISSPGGDYLDV